MFAQEDEQLSGHLDLGVDEDNLVGKGLLQVMIKLLIVVGHGPQVLEHLVNGQGLFSNHMELEQDLGLFLHLELGLGGEGSLGKAQGSTRVRVAALDPVLFDVGVGVGVGEAVASADYVQGWSRQLLSRLASRAGLVHEGLGPLHLGHLHHF